MSNLHTDEDITAACQKILDRGEKDKLIDFTYQCMIRSSDRITESNDVGDIIKAAFALGASDPKLDIYMAECYYIGDTDIWLFFKSNDKEDLLSKLEDL